MDEHDDVALNVKAILLATGGAALAACLFVLSRRREEATPVARAEAAVKDATKDARTAAERAAKEAKQEAKRKRKDLAETAVAASERISEGVRETATAVGFDRSAMERDLKAAAWDAQQEAREAEGRLRAAGLRVVDDAAHIASRVGAEARSLAGGGRERIASLRHRETSEHDPQAEIARLRGELEELRSQLGGAGRRAGRDYRGLTARIAGKTGPVPDAVASEAAAAALAHLEKALRAKAPALITAKNRAQVVEILRQELTPALKEAAAQAAGAAFAKWESARERGEEAKERGREAADEATESARRLREEAEASAREAAHDARQRADEAVAAVERHAEEIRANGKRRFWQTDTAVEAPEAAATAAAEADVTEPAAGEAEDARRGKAGLLWGGAGLGLALYALLDEERRERVLRLANEASIQVQELVRDLQGYDDEF